MNKVESSRENEFPEEDRELVDPYQSGWYRLDNAATLFSLITSSRNTCMFRLSASFYHRINVKDLQQALDNIIERFPYYKVNLRPGFFWYYWASNNGKPRVILDSRYPCQKMPINWRGIMPFRVRAYKNRVAVEFHHSITDGTGAMIFIQALITEYLKKRGVEIVDHGEIFRPGQVPHPEEYEDAFKKNYEKTIPPPISLTKGFQMPFKLEPRGVYNITTGIVPVKKIMELAKTKEVSLTEFLAALYILCLQDIFLHLPPGQQRRKARPIRIMIPVNARKIYPSQTMRNFFLSVFPGIDPRLGEHSFDEILKIVYHYMRVEVNHKFCNMQIKRNVRAELLPVLRLLPLGIKQNFARLVFSSGYGENVHSGVLTNLGRITLPREMEDSLERFEFIPAPSAVVKNCCALISYKDKLYISFGRVIKETELERLFFSKLRKMGVPVKIETN